MATPIIRIDQPTPGAGTPGVSRTDLISGETITFVDTANGAATTWTLVGRPVGSAAVLTPSGNDVTLVPDIVGSYLVKAENGGDSSGTTNAIGEFDSTQGGAGIKLANGTLIPAANEKHQQDAEHGWAVAMDTALRALDTLIGGGGGGNTLDQAYDQGGAGAGRAITADADAVTITSTASDGNNVLEVVKNPATPQAGFALEVTGGTNHTDFAMAINGKRILDVAQTAESGALGPPLMTIQAAAHTTLDNTTFDEVDWDFNRTVQFAGGGGAFTYTTMRLRAPTLAAAAAQSLQASTLIVNAPVAGTNVTLTEPWAIAGGQQNIGRTDIPTGDTQLPGLRIERLFTGPLTPGERFNSPHLSLIGLDDFDGTDNAHGFAWQCQPQGIAAPARLSCLYQIGSPPLLSDSGWSPASPVFVVQSTGTVIEIGTIFAERTTVPDGAPAAGFGTLWVRDDAPNVLVFTDDTGVDTVLGAAGASNTLDGAYDQGGAGAGRTITVDSGAVRFEQPVLSGGSPTIFEVVGGANTTLVASVEATDVDFILARNVQWATGALATQRAIRVQPPGYTFVGASVITDAATMAIDGAPTAGVNATITNNAALWVDADLTFLDDGIEFVERADHVRTPPAGKGALWVRNDTPNVLVFTDDTGVDTVLGAGGGGGNTLDAAYDQGGAGAGRTITADTGAVVITNTVNDTNNMLEISKLPTSDSAGDLIDLTNNVFHTGDILGVRLNSNSANTALRVERVGGSNTNSRALQWTESNAGSAPVLDIQRSATATGLSALFQRPTLGNTSVLSGAVEVENDTAATAGGGNEEFSPMVVLTGHGHDGSADREYQFAIQTQPEDGATTASFHVLHANGGGAFSTVFSVDEQGDATVPGKLNVTGLIDPTGLVLTEQATVPGGAPVAGDATLWVRNDTPNALVFTDDAGTDHDLQAANGVYVLQTEVTLTGADDDQDIELGVAAYDGDVIGVSVRSDDIRTAGDVTFNVQIGGVTTISAVIDGTNTQSDTTTATPGTHSVTAGDRISVNVVEGTGFTPATTTMRVQVHLTNGTVTTTSSSGGGTWTPVSSIEIDTGIDRNTMTWPDTLDLDTDKAYRIDFCIRQTSGATRELILVPNTTTTNQRSTGKSGSSGGFGNVTDTRLVMNTGDREFLIGWLELFKLSSSDEIYYRCSSSQHDSAEAAADHAHQLFCGVWNVTTNVTGLAISLTDTGYTLQADMAAGSWATLSQIDRGTVNLVTS